MRENDRSVTINVKQATGGTATCQISYTINQAGTENVISTSAQNWSSQARVMNPGDYMKVTVSSTSSQCDYTITIYVDGGIWQQTQLRGTQGSATLSGNIPGI